MWKVVEHQYGQNLGTGIASNVVDVISPLSSIENEIREWERTLPQALKTVNASEFWSLVSTYDPQSPQAKANRCRVVLTLRALNLTILLHRPVLVKLLELASLPDADPSEVALLKSLGHTSITTCFRSSQTIITIVSTLVASAPPLRQLLNAWWFTLYYSKRRIVFRLNQLIFEQLSMRRSSPLASYYPICTLIYACLKRRRSPHARTVSSRRSRLHPAWTRGMWL